MNDKDDIGIEELLNNVEIKNEPQKSNKDYSNISTYKEKMDKTNNNATKTTNKVALKFKAMVIFMKFFGYGASLISFFILIKELEQVGLAFICLLGGAIATWLSTLIFEAISEGLQLLQDIKDK